MNDGVGRSGAFGEARRVFERGAMGGDAGGVERLGAHFRARSADDAMAGGEQFGDDGGADEAGGAGEEYAQGRSPG